MTGRRGPEGEGVPQPEIPAKNIHSIDVEDTPSRYILRVPGGFEISIDVRRTLRSVEVTHRTEAFLATRSQMAILRRLKGASVNELLALTRIDGTRRSESASGDTISFESGGPGPIMAEASRQEDFRTVTEEAREARIPSYVLKSTVWEARLPVIPMTEVRLGEPDPTVTQRAEQLQDEVAVLYEEMTPDEYRDKWGVDFTTYAR